MNKSKITDFLIFEFYRKEWIDKLHIYDGKLLFYYMEALQNNEK